MALPQTPPRANKKGSDEDILRLNGVGFSQQAIANIVGSHATSITARLKRLNVEPVDTRRAFMENVIRLLPEDTAEWLADQMVPPDGSPPVETLQEFIANSIKARYTHVI